MQGRIFYTACFGFVLGVLLRSFLFVNPYFSVFLLIVFFALLFFFILISKNKWGIIASIFFLAFSFGIIRFHIADVLKPQSFEQYVGKETSFSGKIVDEPDVRENNQKLIIKTQKGEEKTKILLSVGFEEDYRYGDEISFSGVLKKPENFITDQGKEFDYVNYLWKDGIFYVMNYPEVEIVSRGNCNFVKNALFYVKNKFLGEINIAIREPESLFMGGLILGEKSSFDESLRQSFINTGTIHIVALSGYNVTIVAEWVMKIFSFLPKNMGIGAGIFAILLFVLLTGGSSTAVRAGIMAGLALFARLIGRNYNVGRALMLTGAGMVLINPFILAFDVSFELSFIATIAVIYLSPKLEKYFMWITSRLGLRDIVSVTVAAYLFVLPFVLYKMGNLSLVALPANVLILPFIPLTMLLGFLTAFFGIFWYALAVPFGYMSYFLLHYELAVIAFFSNIPFAALSFPDFPFIFTLLIYACFLYRLFGEDIVNFFREPF